MSARGEWARVGAGFLALALVLAAWLAIDRRPPEWDHANHLERAVLCAQDLKSGDVRAILERSSFYPPLVLCLAAFGSRVMPIDAAAGAVMIAFLGLGMAAVYVLGRALAGGSVGVAAALLYGSAPFVVFSTLRFQLDVPLAAMVAWALVALLASENFTRLPAALAFGVLCGLGMLTKPTFALYVLPPAALALVRGRRRGVINATLAVLVGIVLSLPWFGPRLFGLGAQLDARAFAQAAESGHAEPLTLAGLTFYPRWLGHQLGLATLALALVGLVVAVVRRRWLLLLAVLAPFAVLGLIQNKNLRYTLPLIGTLAVLAALGLGAVPERARRVVARALIVVALVQVLVILAGTPVFWIPGLQAWWLPNSPPMTTAWPHHDVLTLIERDRRGAPATVSIVPNAPYFSVSNFRYYAIRDGLDLRIVRAWDDPPLGIDYMVLKSGDVGPSWTAEKARRVAARLESDPYLARAFPVIGELPLPDGSKATVRARHIPPVAAAPAAVATAVERGLRKRLDEVARELEGLEIRVAHDEAILAGRIAKVEIRAAAATLGEFNRPGTARLRVRDLRVALDDLVVNPWSALAEERFDPLDAGRARIETATVTLPDLQAFVSGLKRFQRSTVAADGDALRITVKQAGPDVKARIRMVAAAGRPFTLVADHVRVGFVPIPDLLVNWVIRNFDPTPRIAARLPFPVEIGRVSVRDQAVRISSER